jgi:hypothetical protein
MYVTMHAVAVRFDEQEVTPTNCATAGASWSTMRKLNSDVLCHHCNYDCATIATKIALLQCTMDVDVAVVTSGAISAHSALDCNLLPLNITSSGRTYNHYVGNYVGSVGLHHA